MGSVGNEAVAKLFAQLAAFSRLHLAEAQKRAAAVDAHVQIPADYVWPDHVTPERTELWAGDPAMSRLDALRAALRGEKRGYEFYYSMAGTATDPDIAAAAKEFVHEEAEHVKVLEAWITREELGGQAQGGLIGRGPLLRRPAARLMGLSGALPSARAATVGPDRLYRC